MIDASRTARSMSLFLVIAGLWTGCSQMHTVPEKHRAEHPAPPTVAARRESIPPTHAGSTQPSSRPAAPKYFVHTVRHSGETLIGIAAWYTGSGENWKRLAKANRGLNPKRIQIGDAIRIPEDILATRRPMPAISLPSRIPEPKPMPAARKSETARDVELFGPIDSPPQPPAPAKDTGLPRALQTID